MFSGFATQAGRTAFCYNCDQRGHVTRDCTKAKVRLKKKKKKKKKNRLRGVRLASEMVIFR
eukprot:4249588-Prymnesium_polylepis.1